MTLPWRETLTWMAIVLIVFLGLGFVVPHLLDFSRLRGTFESSFSSSLNTPVTINGSIDLELLPEPHLIMNKVSLGSESAGFALSIERIEVELAAMSLLRGEVHIVRASLDKPALSLTMQADGSFPVLPKWNTGEAASPSSWSGAVEDLRISQGAVLLRTAPGAAPIAFRNMAVSGQAGHLSGPWRFEGDGDFQSRPVNVLLTSGSPDDTGMLRARLQVASKIDDSKFVIDGKFAVEKNIRFDGKISMAGKMQWPDRDGFSNQPWSIVTEARVDGRALDLRTIAIEGGGDKGNLKLEGSGLGTLGLNGSISARLEARQLDLDKALMADGLPPPRLAHVVEAWKTAIVGLPRDPSLAPVLDLSLAVDGVVLGGDSLTNLDMALRIDQKGIGVSRVNASLPGDATVKIKGTASLDYGGSFSGHVALNAKDAPHLLGWLESESSGRSSRVGDAKTLIVDSDLSISPFNFGASNLKLTIDKSMMSGLVTYNLPEQGTRGKLIAQFYSERLLLDQVPDARAVTSRLNGTDIELTIRADNVEVPRAAGSQAGKMILKASASENGIVIDTLDIADLGGASVKASGRLTAAGEKIDLKIDAPNSAPLMALVKKLIPGNVPVYLSERSKALSPLKLVINAERGADPMGTIKFAYDGMAATTALKGQGLIKSSPDDADVTMKFDFASADAPQALRQLGFEIVPLALEGGAKLSGTVEGRFGQGLVVNLTSGIGALALDGNFKADVKQGRYTGSLNASSPDILPMLQILAMPVPDSSQRMPIKVQSKLDLNGNQIKFVDVKGSIAGQNVNGAVALDTLLDRVDGRLDLETVSLGALASLGIGVIGPAVQGSFWSSQRFTPPVAPPFDINMDLTSKRFDVAQGKFAENVKAKLHWQQDGIEIRDLDGAFLKGRLTGTLTLRRQGALANYILKAKATGLPISSVMSNSSLDGLADLDLDASGAGDALSTLIASASGGGTITMTKGDFAKLDVSALNAATEKLDSDPSPIDLRKVRDQVSSALDRSSLSLAGVTSTITISNGVARIGPVQINKPPYSLQGTINADLKALKIESRFNLYTDQGPQNWSGPMPQIGMVYRTNAQGALEREVDASTLTNILTTRQVSRELQRLEAQQREQLRLELVQYDQRERMFFDKRVKLGRDLDERARKLAEAQRLAEEQRLAEQEKKAQQDFFNSIQKTLPPLPPQAVTPQPVPLQPLSHSSQPILIPLPPLPQGPIPFPPDSPEDPVDPLSAP